jgi:hypothetical protein
MISAGSQKWMLLMATTCNAEKGMKEAEVFFFSIHFLQFARWLTSFRCNFLEKGASCSKNDEKFKDLRQG